MTNHITRASRWIRLLRHLWVDRQDADRLFGPDWRDRLGQEIARIESGGASELRVCVEAALPWSWLIRSLRSGGPDGVRQRALHWFGQLGVWDTEHNSGLLIYVLLADHAIEIVADRGLARIPAEHWQSVADQLAQDLREGRSQQALSAALQRCAQLLEGLKLPADVSGNELPDQPHLV